ncbi:MAG: SCO family protein [Armatimonadetes bacterium]|nr:SCO family protein [Armatimonadota bacterium]
MSKQPLQVLLMNNGPGRSRNVWESTLAALLLLLTAILFWGCGNAVGQASRSYQLTDEHGRAVTFPNDYRGRKLVVSYIYTHCPDVCIVTTTAIEKVRKQLAGKGDDVSFVSITLDPRRDDTTALRQYAELRGIDTQNWHFLTGAESTVDSLLDDMGLVRRRSFIEQNESGRETYFIDHDDPVVLWDREGAIRDRFKGTTLNSDDVAQAIHELP